MTPYVLAVTNDQHCGSTVALCPPQISLDDGGHYSASPLQGDIWNCWGNYWDRVEQTTKKLGAGLIQIFNGDLTEGDHHGTTQILTGNPTAQSMVVNAALAIPKALNPESMFFVRGTEAHVGKSGAFEERIADGLKRDGMPVIGDPSTGTASWWHLRREIGGVRLDVAHHGRTGQREHTRGSAAVLHAHDILLAYVKANELPPHLCLRAHYHKFNDSGDACPVRVVTNGAWQLKTSHGHKVVTDSLSEIGGIIVVIQDGQYTVEKVHYKPKEVTWTRHT